jgi:hypothetical protein
MPGLDAATYPRLRHSGACLREAEAVLAGPLDRSEASLRRRQGSRNPAVRTGKPHPEILSLSPPPKPRLHCAHLVQRRARSWGAMKRDEARRPRAESQLCTRAALGLRPGSLRSPARSWLMTVRLWCDVHAKRRRTPLSTPSAERFAPTGRRSGSGALTAKARPGVWRKNRREMSMRFKCRAWCISLMRYRFAT